MVAMCAGCNDFRPWFAVLIGAVAGASFIGWHYAILKIRIDDPLDAVAGQLLVLGHIMRGQSTYDLILMSDNHDYMYVKLNVF